MIALDSSFPIGFHNERDSHHAGARSLMVRFLDDSAIILMARSRSQGLILSFDEEFRKIAGLRVNPV